MNKKSIILIALLLNLGLFYSSYRLTLYLYPNVVFAVASANIGLEKNVFVLTDLPNSDLRKVVKPNPDFLYVIAKYDLSEGPLRLTGTLPHSSYWSLALYQPNTINFYVKNDQQFNQPELNLILRYDQDDISPTATEPSIISPTIKGMILFRILAIDPSTDNVNMLKKYQESIRLTPAE